MSEVAAGALFGEQVVATGVGAAAALAVAKPTQPLKVSLTQLEDSDDSVGRCNHTLTTIGGKAYIFGGQAPNGQLCDSNVYTITIPTQAPELELASEVKNLTFKSFPSEDTDTGETCIPAPRTRHAACAIGKYLVIHGGRDIYGKPIEEDNCFWLWDTEELRWSRLRSKVQIGKVMVSRWGHHIFVDPVQGFIILNGGHTNLQFKSTAPGASSALSDWIQACETETWLYDFDSNSWTALPKSPAPAVAGAYVDKTLYTISHTYHSRTSSPRLSSVIHYLRLLSSSTEREKAGALVWRTVPGPTNPLAPGPQPRESSALVPLYTGHGRCYLAYIFGCGEEEEHPDPQQHHLDVAAVSTIFFSDIWTLQLPAHGFTAASIKDKIFDKLPGLESGEFTWAPVELVPAEQSKRRGKVHPGPRARFGADTCLDGKGVVLWGGVNPKGRKEDDGWVLSLAYGHADKDRSE